MPVLFADYSVLDRVQLGWPRISKVNVYVHGKPVALSLGSNTPTANMFTLVSEDKLDHAHATKHSK